MISVPAVDKKRYYSVMLVDANTFNFGYIGVARHGLGRRRLPDRRPGLAGADAGRHQAGVPERRRSSRWRSSARSSSTRPTCRTSKRSRRATSCSRSRRTWPACPAGRSRDRHPEDRQGTREDRVLRLPRLRPAVRAGRARGAGHPREAGAASASVPGKTFEFKDLSARAQGRDPARHEGRLEEGRREGRRHRQGDQRLARRARRSAIARSSTATGCCAPPPRARASTGTTPRRRCTRW